VAASSLSSIGRLGYLMGQADAALELVLIGETSPSITDEFEEQEWKTPHRIVCRRAFIESEIYQAFDAERQDTFQFGWERGYGAGLGADPLDFEHDDYNPRRPS
jgi:hypothetical protein